MIDELFNSGWFVPLIIAFLQIYHSQKVNAQNENAKKLNENFTSMQRFMEQNSIEIKDLEKQLNKLEMSLKGDYLPRVEFNDFLDKLDKRFEAMDERVERSLIDIEKIIKLEIKTVIAEIKVGIKHGD